MQCFMFFTIAQQMALLGFWPTTLCHGRDSNPRRVAPGWDLRRTLYGRGPMNVVQCTTCRKMWGRVEEVSECSSLIVIMDIKCWKIGKVFSISFRRMKEWMEREEVGKRKRKRKEGLRLLCYKWCRNGKHLGWNMDKREWVWACGLVLQGT